MQPSSRKCFAAPAGDDRRAYVKFLVNEGPERVRRAYQGQTWDRLRSIKAQYDPTTLFRHNQNTLPVT